MFEEKQVQIRGERISKFSGIAQFELIVDGVHASIHDLSETGVSFDVRLGSLDVGATPTAVLNLNGNLLVETKLKIIWLRKEGSRAECGAKFTGKSLPENLLLILSHAAKLYSQNSKVLRKIEGLPDRLIMDIFLLKEAIDQFEGTSEELLLALEAESSETCRSLVLAVRLQFQSEIRGALDRLKVSLGKDKVSHIADEETLEVLRTALFGSQKQRFLFRRMGERVMGAASDYRLSRLLVSDSPLNDRLSRENLHFWIFQIILRDQRVSSQRAIDSAIGRVFQKKDEVKLLLAWNGAPDFFLNALKSLDCSGKSFELFLVEDKMSSLLSSRKRIDQFCEEAGTTVNLTMLELTPSSDLVGSFQKLEVSDFDIIFSPFVFDFIKDEVCIHLLGAFRGVLHKEEGEIHIGNHRRTQINTFSFGVLMNRDHQLREHREIEGFCMRSQVRTVSSEGHSDDFTSYRIVSSSSAVV